MRQVRSAVPEYHSGMRTRRINKHMQHMCIPLICFGEPRVIFSSAKVLRLWIAIESGRAPSVVYEIDGVAARQRVQQPIRARVLNIELACRFGQQGKIDISVRVIGD